MQAIICVLVVELWSTLVTMLALQDGQTRVAGLGPTGTLIVSKIEIYVLIA